MSTVTPTPESAYQAEIARAVTKGWRVESQTDYATTLVKGHRTNHVLHLILSVITVGVWIPVWVCMAVFAGEKHKTIRRA